MTSGNDLTKQRPVAAAGIPRLPRRLAPVLGLLLLAPVCAEYLTGYDDSTGDPLELLGGLTVFVPLYGAAALIIREVARRAGRGWPTMFLLALAFGVLQPGLIDQAMFNPSYRDIDYLQPMMEPTYIPALGISAYLSLTWVIGHVIWSISVPIAIVETFVPDRRTTPWLGIPGLVVAVLMFLAAAAVVVRWHLQTEQFIASVPQMAGAAVVVLALIAAAFAIGKRPRPRIDRLAPSPWLVGVAAFTALYLPDIILGIIADASAADPAIAVDWRAVAVSAAFLAVLVALLAHWSRRAGWGAPHRLAVAGGALLTNVVIAFAVEPIGDVELSAKLTHNTVLAVGAVTLLALAARQARRTGE